MCEDSDPLALRTLFAVFGSVGLHNPPAIINTGKIDNGTISANTRTKFTPLLLRLLASCQKIFRGLPATVRYSRLFSCLNGMLICLIDKAVGGVGYVGDHLAPIDFLHEDGHGFGKMGPKDINGVAQGYTNVHVNGITNGVM